MAAILDFEGPLLRKIDRPIYLSHILMDEYKSPYLYLCEALFVYHNVEPASLSDIYTRRSRVYM